MSRGYKKYKREHVAWADEIQAKFNARGEPKVKQKPVTTFEGKYSMTEQFACPFCLAIHEFRRYLISTKKGIHQGLAECPECKNKCRITTLTGAMTPTEYADYIYTQVRSGIWQKIPFNKWKQRLYKLGWAGEFWKQYKKLKAQDADGTPIDDEREKEIEQDWEAYEERYGGEVK